MTEPLKQSNSAAPIATLKCFVGYLLKFSSQMFLEKEERNITKNNIINICNHGIRSPFLIIMDSAIWYRTSCFKIYIL